MLNERPGRCKCLDVVSRNPEQASQSAPYGAVVVDHDDADPALRHGGAAVAAGIGKWNAAPPEGLSCAQMTPSGAPMSDRQMARPIPMPVGFLVHQGSK